MRMLVLLEEDLKNLKMSKAKETELQKKLLEQQEKVKGKPMF